MQGWYRVLCDDARLLRLVERHADPDAPLATVLDPVAELFGVRAEVVGRAVRVDDARGATVAVAMPLPAGRERPCEIITPPIETDHAAALERLLVPARELGFTVPQEAAVHLHVDGAPFRRPEAFANVVRLFGHWRQQLWAALDTNPACRRLAPLPDGAAGPRGDERRRTRRRPPASPSTPTSTSRSSSPARPLRDTLEVRILPGAIDGPSIVRRAALVEALLARCLDPHPLPRPDEGATLDDLLGVRR